MNTSVGNGRGDRNARAFSGWIAPALAAFMLLVAAPDRAEGDIMGGARKQQPEQPAAPPPATAPTPARPAATPPATGTPTPATTPAPARPATGTPAPATTPAPARPATGTPTPATTPAPARPAAATPPAATPAPIRPATVTYTLTVNREPTAGGTVTPATQQSGIAAGTPVFITAAADSNHAFVNWTVVYGQARIADTGRTSTTVTLSSDATIRANFQQRIVAPATYRLTVNQRPTAGGTVTPTSQANISAETPVGIRAAAADGYRFINWTVVSGQARFADANSATTTVAMRSNATIAANFQQTFSLTVNRNQIAGGTVASAAQSGITPDMPTNITATPANGYRFLNWTVTGGQAWFANANNPRTTVVLNSDAAIMANFQQTFTLTVDQNPTEGGTVTSESQSGIIAGIPVNITAAAMPGYRFVNWTVTGGQAWFADANNPGTTVSLNTDATITANFQRGGAVTKKPTVLTTFGIGWQTIDYERRLDDENIVLNDQDRTVASGTKLGVNVFVIGKSGFTVAAGTDLVIGSGEGININPMLGLGYVSYRKHYVGTTLNFIANAHIIPEESYVNPYNNQRGDVFIAPTFLTGYDYGAVSLGVQLSYMYGIMSSVSGFNFSAGLGINIARQ